MAKLPLKGKIRHFCAVTFYIIYDKFVCTNKAREGLGENCQLSAVRSDDCQIGQLSVETTVSGDNCQWPNCQWKL